MITPRFDLCDFVKMFKDIKSIAIIGNSESILEWNNGELIDSFDMVVRFNCAYTKDLEMKIGHRTDVLIANRNYSLDRSPSPAKILKPKCLVSFVTVRKDINYDAFRQWAGNIPTLLAFTPDLLEFTEIERTRPLTSGTNALYTFLHLFHIKKLFITGFSFYGIGSAGTGNYCLKNQKKYRGGTFHDLDCEARIFTKILDNFNGELITTPDIQEILRRNKSSHLHPKKRLVKKAWNRIILVEWLCDNIGKCLVIFGFRLRRWAEKSGRLHLGKL